MAEPALHVEIKPSTRWRIVFWITFSWVTLYAFSIFYAGGVSTSQTVHWHLLTPVQAWAIWINYEPLALVIPTTMANLVLLLAAWRITLRRNARVALGVGFSLHAILFLIAAGHVVILMLSTQFRHIKISEYRGGVGTYVIFTNGDLILKTVQQSILALPVIAALICCLADWIRPSYAHMYLCRKCGYDLKGTLPENKTDWPECGKTASSKQ